MGKREIPEVNAGSMADIAFLLLVFFLVTTTINVPETGIPSKVPEKPIIRDYPKMDPTIVEDYDILNIQANKRNQLLIEKELYKPEDVNLLYDYTKLFYSSHHTAYKKNSTGANDINGDGITDFPIRWKVTQDTINQTISKLEGMARAAQATNQDEVIIKYFEQQIDKWKFKKEILKEIGNYYELPDKSSIKLEVDKETTYGFYVSVLDNIYNARKEVLNKASMEIYNMPYDELNPPKNKEVQVRNAKKIRLIETLYPPEKFKDLSETKLLKEYVQRMRGGQQ